MVLAAGLGTRMAPLSKRRAKPALPVLDEPILARLVRGLAEAGVTRVVVNAHAHPEQLRDALARAPVPVELSFESELLGSGGGVLAARSWLEGAEPFLVVNADMSLDLDLDTLRRAHAAADPTGGRPRATLLLRDDPRKQEFGTLGYDSAGRIARITSLIDASSGRTAAGDGVDGSTRPDGREVGSALFTGVQLLEPGVFDDMPEPPFDLVRELYAPWLRAEGPGVLRCVVQDAGASWQPIGSPRELLDVNLAALRRAAASSNPPPELQAAAGGPCWVGRGARIDPRARIGRDTIVGAGAELAAEVRLEESLVLPGARPPAGRKLVRVIAFDEEVWQDG